jgi:hypothetical protein
VLVVDSVNVARAGPAAKCRSDNRDQAAKKNSRQCYSGVFAFLPQSEERQESDDDDDGTDDIDDPVHEHFLRVEGESPARRHDIAADQRSLLRPDNLYASAQTIPRRFSNIWP